MNELRIKQAELEIKDLQAAVEGKEILKGINLSVKKGEIVAIMGPNGSGKSTLASIIMGNPMYEVTGGNMLFKDSDLNKLSPDERAKLGLFLSFQYPSSVPGVTISNFLRTALNQKLEKKIPISEFVALLKEKMSLLKIDESFVDRYINDGFSGGEKKRNEILQLAVLNPDIAILDETDSGTDVDALRIIANGINTVRRSSGLGVLLITHYNRILQYIKPDRVVVLMDGRIVKEGGPELADRIESEGYDWIRAESE